MKAKEVKSSFNKKPILITGSHRSGTTWVGKMIALDPSIGYIHEPFNLDHNSGICGANFKHWYTYITKENELLFLEQIRRTVGFQYDIIGALRAIRSAKDSGKKFSQYFSFLINRLNRRRPLIKDPIAFFSAEWLARIFNMDVLIMIRHPAGFVSSLKRLNWGFQFSKFLDQPLLIRDWLYPFEAQIQDFVKHKYDIIDQGILLWRIIHYVIIEYQKTHKNWIFLKHEDISKNPLEHFQRIFQNLELDFTSKVKATIQKYSDPTNPVDVPESKGSMFIKRDSIANIFSWKDRLTEEEIKRIRRQVEDISSVFYEENKW